MEGLATLELDDGTTVYVEARDVSPAGPERLRRGGRDVTDKVTHNFERALDQVRPAAEKVIETFRTLQNPSEVGVEFSLKFSAAVDAFVFSGDAEATFKITLSWKRESSEG